MLIKDLIKKLSEYPDNTRIMINGYEGGLLDLKNIFFKDVIINYRGSEKESGYSGNHELLEYYYDIEEENKNFKIEKCLIFSRS